MTHSADEPPAMAPPLEEQRQAWISALLGTLGAQVRLAELLAQRAGRLALYLPAHPTVADVGEAYRAHRPSSRDPRVCAACQSPWRCYARIELGELLCDAGLHELL